MNRIFVLMLALVASVGAALAQIGYQVTVFDPATKAPKANTTVSASVTISDNSGKTICSESFSGTTDEFGILSMTVGGASTFANVDWSKLPLWISASVDGVTISKTQIMTVPVAEYAKKTGTLTKEILCSRSWGGFSFYSDGTLRYSHKYSEKVSHGRFYIDGNSVIGYIIDNSEDGVYNWPFIGHYVPQTGQVYVIFEVF